MGISTNKTGIALFIDMAVRCGMRQVVCSPGSRNAPLVIAIDLHPDLEALVIHDERSAAFYALGMAIQTGRPVGVACTSGSAMLNYYPAVAEAYYQGVPLVVMSADRPAEWVNHGDGQTIVQTGVYDNHIRGQMQVPETVGPDEYTVLEEQIADVFKAAMNGWVGPVHFNFPITEPMYGTAPWEHRTDPIVWTERQPECKLDSSFLDHWVSSERRMILCGQMNPDGEVLHLLSRLAEDASVAILVENTSNQINERFIHCIDRALSAVTEEELETFQPDVLVSLGGAVISKKIKSFLRKAPLKAHCRVAHDFPEMDTYRALTSFAEADTSDFLRALLREEAPANRSLFGSRWKGKDYLMDGLARTFVSAAPYSDLTVCEWLLDTIPAGSVIHMGNSSVVRYCQLFNPVQGTVYRSNRGTSGIDGSLSTACGAAWVDPENLHVAITGDVSFFYDSNALWSQYLSPNLRIVLINNSGGGIFRIIEGPSDSDQLVKYFEAPPKGRAEDLCKAFDVGYQSADSLEILDRVLPQFLVGGDGPGLLEIKTPSEINDKVLKQFFGLAMLNRE